MSSKKKLRIGVAASTGGLNTFSTLGIIRFFKEHNIKIEACAGSSGGSFPLSAFCCGIDLRTLDGQRLVPELKKSFFDPDKKALAKTLIKFLAYVLGMKIKNPLMGIESMGYCRGDTMLALLKEKFGNLTFKDTIIPLYVPAWNISAKRVDLFHKNGLNPTLAEAVRMTSSIPMIFRPYSYNNDLYWDGGITSSLPVKELLENEPDINFIIMIDTISGNDLVLNPLNKPMSFMYALNDIVIGLQNTQIQESIEYAKNKLGEENVILLAPPHRCGWTAFDRIPTIISEGYQLARNAFVYNQKLHSILETED